MKESVYKSYDELPLFLNLKIGAPSKTKRSGFAGERRSSGMSEPCYLRQGEGYGACDDEAKILGVSLSGGERSHPHRADDGAEQRRQAAQRKPALHHLPDPGGNRIVLRAAVPAAGGGCRPSEGDGMPRRIGPRKPPERPVCAFRSGSESQCRSGVRGPIWPAFGGASGDERKSSRLWICQGVKMQFI